VIEPIQAISLGLLQGISELFPVSSLAQTILLPALIGWHFDRSDTDFLAFVVALHLATAVALLIFFWRDWKVVFEAYLGSAKRGKLVYDQASKFAWLLVAGTIITGLVGAVVEKKVRKLFENPKYFWIVAAVLVLNGVFMLFVELLKKNVSKSPSPAEDSGTHAAGEGRHADDLTFIEATAIGATQSFALVPGVSRSGVTIVAGLLAGLSYEEAGRFSFMLATPIIGLAALKEMPMLLKPDMRPMLGVTVIAALIAGVTAYLSVRFLMRYFRHNGLGPFGWYCIAFGLYAFFKLR
jgi:undecaprenyl-diphosphatase